MFEFTFLCMKLLSMGKASVQKRNCRTEEMAEELRAFAAIAKDPNSVPSTHI